MTALFFWLFSVGMIVCALAVVFNRNAVASALCFTFTIVFMAGLFIMLSAFFLAAVQILVTAGAVMVLFLFIIMLLDLTAMEHVPRHKVWTACSVVLAFLGLIGKTLSTMPPQQWPATQQASESIPVTLPAASVHGIHQPTHGVLTITKPEPTQSQVDKNDDTHQIGRMLFSASKIDPVTGEVTTSYIAPFEITSLLILVATIGVIVLCKEDDRPKAYRREEIAREAPPVREQEPSFKS